MSVESFNACVYLVDRQVQAGRGGHLAVTGPAGSLTYAELAARAAELAATGKIQRVVVREVVARRLGKPGE
jgi:acyl-coenzyme A synthetase/AMP-(fatty) acid ligase